MSTAEGALCCIFMLARRVEEQQQSFRKGRLGLPLGMQLQGQTLGIIGFGAIGTPVAQSAVLSTQRSILPEEACIFEKFLSLCCHGAEEVKATGNIDC